ncbi:MAG: YdeI/OmpD-associated family protein [Caldilineaceae bacterium]
MEITKTLHLSDREAWRQWLQEHHASETEIWLVSYTTRSGKPRIPYLDSVEEALCFGWIDGIAKKLDDERTAQRFTPRRARSNWTELNKERVRRLIAAGKMTPAGLAVAPDLSPDAFRIPDDILAAIQADPLVWENFQRFPDLYVRIRIGFIDEVRKQPAVFQQRLDNFVKQTRNNKMFGGLE